MNVPYAAEIERVLHTRQPRSLLVMGDPAPAPFADYIDTHNDCRCVVLPVTADLGTLKDLSHFDLAFVAPAIADLPKTKATQLLAALRDRYAQHLIVAVATDDTDVHNDLTSSDFLALGMRHLGDGSAGRAYALYEFDIVDYKNTPDWLNSQHWAHPELFDKFRW